ERHGGTRQERPCVVLRPGGRCVRPGAPVVPDRGGGLADRPHPVHRRRAGRRDREVHRPAGRAPSRRARHGPVRPNAWAPPAPAPRPEGRHRPGRSRSRGDPQRGHGRRRAVVPLVRRRHRAPRGRAHAQAGGPDRAALEPARRTHPVGEEARRDHRQPGPGRRPHRCPRGVEALRLRRERGLPALAAVAEERPPRPRPLQVQRRRPRPDGPGPRAAQGRRAVRGVRPRPERAAPPLRHPVLPGGGAPAGPDGRAGAQRRPDRRGQGRARRDQREAGLPRARGPGNHAHRLPL
ncbi:MAG: hypothetical protein AVDCRST_MAG47-1345, partial [uncultured Nocardioidaceae bacterium]